MKVIRKYMRTYRVNNIKVRDRYRAQDNCTNR